MLTHYKKKYILITRFKSTKLELFVMFVIEFQLIFFSNFKLSQNFYI